MKQLQEQHLANIKEDFAREVDKKYRAGQEQHGGDLWAKKDLINKALEEIIDLYVYMSTLKTQIENKTIYSVTEKDIDE